MEISYTELILLVWGCGMCAFALYMSNKYLELVKIMKTLMYLIESKQTDKITILRNEHK